MRKLIVKSFVIFFCLGSISGCRLGIEQRRNMISPMPFKKQNWDVIASVPDDFQYRPRMARELIAKNLLVGKTRSEVFEMLGKDDLGKNDKQKIISYTLEDIYAENIDPIAYEVLNITFDDNEKVEKAQIEFHKTGDW